MSIDLTSEDLLRRLRDARQRRGLSQQEVAERLGVARTTLVAVETGQRPLRADELLLLSRIYEEPLELLLRPEPAAAPLALQFRWSSRRSSDDKRLRDATEELQRLAEDYVELERILAAPLPERHPPERPVPHGDLDAHAAALADEERRRIGLGDGPLPHLREILEDEVGFRVFALDLPAQIGGLFAYDTALGACIAVNSSHRWERQRWSLAHEYAHFLTRRDRPEVTVSVEHYRRVPASERFADHFARHLLLPSAGLRRRWQAVQADRPTVATLIAQADWWGVSVQAFVLQLEALRLIRSGTYDKLVVQGLAVDSARDHLGLARRPSDTTKAGRRMRSLAATALLDGDLSEERLTRMLGVDRLSARQLVSPAEEVAGA